MCRARTPHKKTDVNTEKRHHPDGADYRPEKNQDHRRYYERLADRTDLDADFCQPYGIACDSIFVLGRDVVFFAQMLLELFNIVEFCLTQVAKRRLYTGRIELYIALHATNGIIYDKTVASDSFIFDRRLSIAMADQIFMFGVTAGIFAFLVAVLFSSRGARKRRGGAEEMVESHSSGSGSSGNEGRRIKKFKSDGTPVYE